jgi:hypothetical protein
VSSGNSRASRSNGASADVFDADALRRLRPSAWILLRAGGVEPLSESLLAEAAADGTPCLVLDADPPPHELFGLLLAEEPPAESLCIDAEAEARAACAQVLAELRPAKPRRWR